MSIYQICPAQVVDDRLAASFSIEEQTMATVKE